MIDIIIPAYNAHETLYKTLSNIALQTKKDKIIVYIVNDCSNKNYQREVDNFSDILSIKEIKTTKRLGPGGARQFGIEHSSSEYILFMDADDQFYNPFALNLLYYNINNGYDIVIGKEVINGILGNFENSNLHGKIYRRSFLIENNIKFNNTKYSEDNSFDQITTNITDKIMKINDPVYLYINNSNSLTSKKHRELEKIILYLYNRIYAAEELEKRNVNPKIIANILLKGYTYTYLNIKLNKKINTKKIYTKCSNYEYIFKKYEKYLTKDEIINNLLKRVNCTDIYSKEILKDFTKLRLKFKGEYYD